MTRRPTPASALARALARALAGALAGAAVLAVAACGQQGAGAVTGGAGGGAGRGAAPTSTDADERAVVRLAARQAEPRLVCPGDDRSTMIADFAHGAEGAATPEEAVGLPGLVRSGEQLVIDARGTTAWVLRPDGTARMEIGLLHDDGWLLHQRTSCG